jgi:hypothetical protein
LVEPRLAALNPEIIPYLQHLMQVLGRLQVLDKMLQCPSRECLHPVRLF